MELKVMFSLRVAAILFFGYPLLAEIVPIPGSVPVKPVFEASDLVCICRADSVSIVRGLPYFNTPRNKVVRQEVKISLTVEDVFKRNQLGSPIVKYVEEALVIYPARSRLQKGEHALLFLKSTSPGIYQFTDPYSKEAYTSHPSIGITPFTFVPHQAGEGLGGLQAALIIIVRQSNRLERIRALQLLEGFDTLDQNSLSAVTELSTSEDAEVAFPALAILLNTKTPESVERLATYLRSYQGKRLPLAAMNVGDKLAQIRDDRARLALEALTNSEYAIIQRGAMDALRGIGNPKSAATLIQHLDSSDRDIQHLAVITLSEIFHKDGPGLDLFYKNPQRYIGLWKKWWAEEGKALTTSEAKPPQ